MTTAPATTEDKVRKVKNIALAFPIKEYNVIKAAAKNDRRSMGSFLFIAAMEYIKAHNL